MFDKELASLVQCFKLTICFFFYANKNLTNENTMRIHAIQSIKLKYELWIPLYKYEDLICNFFFYYYYYYYFVFVICKNNNNMTMTLGFNNF